MSAETATRESKHPRVAAPRANPQRAPRNPADIEQRARELLTMAAHDLRSPLAAIKFRAAAVTRRWQAGAEPTSAEWASAVFRMSRAADDAFELIEDLLSLERLDDPLEPTADLPTDVGNVIEEAIAQQREVLEEARRE